MILLIVFLVVVVAVAAFAVFGPPARMLTPPTRQRDGGDRGSPLGARPTYGVPNFGARVPHMHELPQGCLIGIIFVALVWFALWAVVLVFALRFLQTPYSGG